MDFKLNEKVYGYYNSQYSLLEGKIIQIGADHIENFYVGELYIIDTNYGLFKIPAKQIFATYEQWKKYYDIKRVE